VAAWPAAASISDGVLIWENITTIRLAAPAGARPSADTVDSNGATIDFLLGQTRAAAAERFLAKALGGENPSGAGLLHHFIVGMFISHF
jgi:hypothetical protein